MDKNYRIRTNIISDTVLNVNMRQDFDFLEVLSLRLSQDDVYKLFSSNYGVIVGRVLANDAFGIPNARISVFIERDENDPVSYLDLYPYATPFSKGNGGIRYNLLPDYNEDECYRVVGTLPNKMKVLDNTTQLEVFDKYLKFSTVTNNAGDYMLFGVPSGNQNIHVDIDLSDIGVLSQKPTDFTYKGYNLTQFDSPTQFKESTNLDILPQIFKQDKSVFVYPFWGDDNGDAGIAAITRSDIQINYKFEPTCVFMGSIVSDNDANAIGHKCSPAKDNGKNDQLVTGVGNIEMIRKTIDGLVEQYQVSADGESLIDGNGVWCYQIPMNLDYVGTDEFGNIVPTDNPNKGVPTRAQVRFRISKSDTGDEGFSRHTAKYLVPMNPIFDEEKIVPTTLETGPEIEKMYNFGSDTPQSCFRDLYWNNVYSVKNYIPKVQTGHRPYSGKYGSLKASNYAGDKNPVPFNKLRFDLKFTYIVLCVVYKVIVEVVKVLNYVVCALNYVIKALKAITWPAKMVGSVLGWIGDTLGKLPGFIGDFLGGLFSGGKKINDILPDLTDKVLKEIHCISLSVDTDNNNTVYFPGCMCHNYSRPDDISEDDEYNPTTDGTDLKDSIERKLAEDFKVVALDFYQDWINGCLYMPLWYWRKRKKKTFFGLFTISKAKNEFCDCDKHKYSRLKTVYTCDLEYLDDSFGVDDETMSPDETKWHKDDKYAHEVRYKGGLVKEVENKDGLHVYYYTAIQNIYGENSPSNKFKNTEIKDIKDTFEAIRLYATDIILLGNLNENNLYGVPQLFTALPSTTQNEPPIATVIDSDDGDSGDNQGNSRTNGGTTPSTGGQQGGGGGTSGNFGGQRTNAADGTFGSGTGDIEDDESGTTAVTGMDWGKHKDAKKDKPKFKNGLFLDLGCISVKTMGKSCVNVERLSELGVNLDMHFRMPYMEGGRLVEDRQAKPDGFISKYELDDTENRAMFATLNHVGFIPQPYQDEKNLYETQVHDDRTNYYIPKFKYIYPVDFDGRLQKQMDDFKNGYEEQSLYDEADESYMTFRFGAESSAYTEWKGSQGRIRHFYYHDEKNGKLATPLYNNSYYFYFGINKGNTAIDKFNTLFYTPCFQNKKEHFSIDTAVQGRSYCPMCYTNPSLRNKYAYGYIGVVVDDIQIPYSYALYDSLGNKVAEDSGLDAYRFVIGGHYVNDDSDEIIADQNNLSNSEYILEITDGDGMKETKRVVLKKDEITLDYDVEPLKTKFYDSAVTNIENVCTDRTRYYGKITIEDIVVDEIPCTITSVTNVNYTDNKYVVDLKCKNAEYSIDTVVRVTLEATDIDVTWDCMCDKRNSPTTAFTPQRTDYSISGTTQHKHYYKFENNIIEFYVYQPSTFETIIEQTDTKCNGEPENKSVLLITVKNGENFNTNLNGMATRFILGTIEDSSSMTIANKSGFYCSTAVTTPYSKSISGWFGVHDEKALHFPETNKENDKVWADFISVNDIESVNGKLAILRYKLNAMFEVSEVIYVTEASSGELKFEHEGGGYVLTRAVAPSYYNEALLSGGVYTYEDTDSVAIDTNYPTIVGDNYDKLQASDNQVRFNPHIPENDTSNLRRYIGNYFAAFSDNGGYSSTTGIDEALIIKKQPNYVAVSADNQSPQPKPLGELRTGPISDFQRAYISANTPSFSQPHLRVMTIDRRFDYNLDVFGEFVGKAVKIYPDSDNNTKKENMWKGCRVSGLTYNGIEMSYDDNYNAVSGDVEYVSATSNEVKKVTANKRLEYSYSAVSGTSDAVTVWNEATGSTVWEGNGLIVKRPYAAIINGVDVRNYFWSTFNKQKLASVSTTSITANGVGETNGPIIFKGHENATNVYNGDFKFVPNESNPTASTQNYPIKRMIDMGRFAPVGEFYMSYISCKYGPTVTSDNKNRIIYPVDMGEQTEIEIPFYNPFTFIPSNADNKTYANAVYSGITGTDGNYKIFPARTLNLNFKFNGENMIGDETLRLPKIVRILPYITYNGTEIDGISYLKAVSGGTNLSNIVSALTINDTTLPQGVSYSNYAFRKNNQPIYGAETEINGISFKKTINANGNVKMFTLMAEKDFNYGEEAHLIRHIHTYEFGDMYDVRPIALAVVGGSVRYTSLDSITSIESEGSPTDAPGKTMVYIQALKFKMKVGTDTTPIDSYCQVFKNYSLMAFTFSFKDSANNVYDINCNDITMSNNELEFNVRWNQDMRYLGDDNKWNGSAKVSLYAKTSDNFVYRVGDFTLTCDSQTPPSGGEVATTGLNIS